MSKNKNCMFIGPTPKTAEEKDASDSLQLVIKECLNELEYEYTPFWDTYVVNMPEGIFSTLVNSELVIADLRGLNPNVMYEVGIRHAFNRKIIQLKDDSTMLPWDIDKNFTITYKNPIQVSHKDSLVAEIKKVIDKLDKEEGRISYSTLYDHIKETAIINKVIVENPNLESVLKLIFNRLESMEISLAQDARDKILKVPFEGRVIEIPPGGLTSTDRNELLKQLELKNFKVVYHHKKDKDE